MGAAKVAREILKCAPEEQAARHCLVVSLIRQSKFAEALSVLDADRSGSLHFERAYCLFRSFRLDEALQLLNDEPEPGHKHGELKAQVLYRLERYSESLQVYAELIRNIADEYDGQREANLKTIMACLGSNDQLNMALGSNSQLNMSLGSGVDDVAASKRFKESRKKKKKKIRLPKRYDPKVAPDPERWLPLEERSKYRPKMKGNRRSRNVVHDVGKGTQGASSAEALLQAENQLDMSKMKASSGVAAPSKTPPVIAAGARDRRQLQKKKRSGKMC